MGTRHLIIVYYKGVYVYVRYGQLDGYPRAAGIDLLKFLADMENIEQLKAVLQAKMDGNSDHIPDSTAVHPAIKAFASMDDPQFIEEELFFITDELFCEWAYVIDLDKDLFDVYQPAFLRMPVIPSNRFNGYTFVRKRHGTNTNGFVNGNGVAGNEAEEEDVQRVTLTDVKPPMVGSFPLTHLPSEEDFLHHFRSDEED